MTSAHTDAPLSQTRLAGRPTLLYLIKFSSNSYRTYHKTRHGHAVLQYSMVLRVRLNRKLQARGGQTVEPVAARQWYAGRTLLSIRQSLDFTLSSVCRLYVYNKADRPYVYLVLAMPSRSRVFESSDDARLATEALDQDQGHYAISSVSQTCYAFMRQGGWNERSCQRRNGDGPRRDNVVSRSDTNRTKL